MRTPPSRSTPDPWRALREFTSARIALGRAGGSLPTAAALEFELAHARARDAVHLQLDTTQIRTALHGFGLEALKVHSAAVDRATYLRRPDLGRRLDADSHRVLERFAASSVPEAGYDAVFVIADGLSALVAQSQAIGVLSLVHEALAASGWRIAPVVIAEQSRVALGDEIGAQLRARQVAILIGERPGLSAVDSLGIYLTYAPRVGCTDANRNCISNIRPGGLSYAQGAHKLVYLMNEAKRLELTGVALKDASEGFPSLVRNAPLTGP